MYNVPPIFPPIHLFPSMSIILESSDGQRFPVDKNAAYKSCLLKTMLEDLGDDSSQTIPLPNVGGATLQKVIDYCEHHKNDEPISKEEEELEAKQKQNFNFLYDKKIEIADEWDATFIKMSKDELFAVLMAANYLDIKPLLDLGCKSVASVIKGKSVEEVRDYFGIVNDFTPEEEERIRIETSWADTSATSNN